MKKTLPALLGLLMALLLSSCAKPSHESLMEDSIGLLEEMATVLEGVDDKASAEAAKPKLDKLTAKIERINAVADKLPKLSKEEQAAILKKYGGRWKAATSKIVSSTLNLETNFENSERMQEAFKDLKNVIE